MLAITTTSERIGRWIKMRRSIAPFSEPESSVHTRFLAGFITTMPGFRFSVHTAPCRIRNESLLTTLTPRGQAIFVPERLWQNDQRICGSLSLRCLLYTSDAADEEDSVDLGGRRIIKKK